MICSANSNDGVVPLVRIGTACVPVAGVANVATETDRPGATDIPHAVVYGQRNGRTGFAETTQSGAESDTEVGRGGSILKLLRLCCYGDDDRHKGKDCFFHRCLEFV
ncbi:hypothetical protein G5B00_12140 [Parapedobacter sp. SGR-10]|uniref:hypothetical protein n=1 Tax=Parapedobacter sp. SGR-10 TaxID=2710879 RepID=UPI0013D407FC|nr:hypothetical protein [Parapedobacter sp. SGR-10]NGF57262.1 hypothetical protein [Parapedobacter sp. SGR-10]